MRIVFKVLTNKNAWCFAVDFYRSWPFFAYESLPTTMTENEDAHEER